MSYFPMIGISGSISKTEKEMSIQTCYTNALMKAGAVPVLLCPNMNDDMLRQCLNGLDGVLLAGGNDVGPECYGQEPLDELGDVCPLRDDFEGRLVRMAAEMKMPLLGICRGIQSINVAMGGTLWQDVPSQYRTAEGMKGSAHSQTRLDFYTSHGVVIEEGTKLYSLMGRRDIRVNSFHHQAVREPAPCMKVAAHAADGLIEAIENPDLPFSVGVQWHPERYFDRDETAMVLFEALVEAARAFRS